MKIENIKERATVNVWTDSHKKATLAANLAGETLVDFLSKASDARAEPILKKHGVKLDSKSLGRFGVGLKDASQAA